MWNVMIRTYLEVKAKMMFVEGGIHLRQQCGSGA